MSIAVTILRRLLFYRPLVTILLVVLYLVTALLLVTVEPGKRATVIAAMGAFAAGGLAAVLTERVARYSQTAGALGLPNHVRTMRFAQGWFLALFVAGPALAASILGMSPLISLAILSIAAALGIALAMWGGWLLIPVVLANQMAPVRQWIALPVVQALATVASAATIWKWFQLPQRAQRVGGLTPLILADARHEPISRRDESAESPAAEKGAEVYATQTRATGAGEGVDSDRNLPAVLAQGIGYSVATAWRRVPYGTALAVLVMGSWHAAHGSSPEELGYIMVTAACCFTAVVRLQAIVQRWMRTPTEQSVLHLTPRWPGPRAIKRAVIVSTVLVQRGAIAVWMVSSLVAALLGWVAKPYFFAGALAVLGTLCAFSGAACAVLAHRRVREWHLSTVALVLLVAAGGLVIFFGVVLPGDSAAGHALAYGAALMVAPPALALGWYTLAPLRVPMNVDPRAIRPARWI